LVVRLELKKIYIYIYITFCRTVAAADYTYLLYEILWNSYESKLLHKVSYCTR